MLPLVRGKAKSHIFDESVYFFTLNTVVFTFKILFQCFSPPERSRKFIASFSNSDLLYTFSRDGSGAKTLYFLSMLLFCLYLGTTAMLSSIFKQLVCWTLPSLPQFSFISLIRTPVADDFNTHILRNRQTLVCFSLFLLISFAPDKQKKLLQRYWYYCCWKLHYSKARSHKTVQYV